MITAEVIILTFFSFFQNNPMVLKPKKPLMIPAMRAMKSSLSNKKSSRRKRLKEVRMEKNLFVGTGI